MARVRILVAALVCTTLIASAPMELHAQTEPAQDVEVGVQAVAASVIRLDPQQLATALEVPITEDELPEGFLAAEFVDPEVTPEPNEPSEPPAAQCLIPTGELPTSQLPETEAIVCHTVEGDPTVLGGIVTVNSLNYVILDPTSADDDVLEDIRLTLEEDIATPAADGAEVTVEETVIAQTEALLLTSQLDDELVNATAQMYLVPVGNVVVIGLVIITDQATIDPEAVRVPAEELTIAGIEHLGTVAEAVG